MHGPVHVHQDLDQGQHHQVGQRKTRKRQSWKTSPDRGQDQGQHHWEVQRKAGTSQVQGCRLFKWDQVVIETDHVQGLDQETDPTKGPDHIRGHFPKRVIQIDMEGNPIQGCQDYQFIRVLKGIETDQIQDHCHWMIVWISIVTKQGPGHLLIKEVKESIAKNHIQDQDYHQIKVQ